MITVLWTMTVASVVTLGAALTGRTSVYAARNRVQSERAYWIAFGCARRVQAAVDDLLREAPTLDDDAGLWRVLNHRARVAIESNAGQCDMTLEAAGTKINVNDASAALLTSLWAVLGIADDQASAMTTALIARRTGGPLIADVRELDGIDGFANTTGLQDVLTADPGRISLATAPVVVLRAVPGFTTETAELIDRLNRDETPLRDPLELGPRLSAESRTVLMSRYADIARTTTADPDAWTLTTRASSGSPPSAVVLQWRLGRVGNQCVIVYTRTTL